MLLPLILNYFERATYLRDINFELFSARVHPLDKRLPPLEGAIAPVVKCQQPGYLRHYLKPNEQMITQLREEESEPLENDVLPEYLNWAMSAGGISSCRQTYETLESYGDTVLKLAATLLAYEWKKDDRKAGEGDIENMKVAFITNSHLFRVGFNLRLQRHIKTLKDPDSKEWVMPLTSRSAEQEPVYTNRCVGKAISDCVEALIGALYLSATNPHRESKTGETGLYRAMRWLDDIKCVPLGASGILDMVKQVKTSSLDLRMPLWSLRFHEHDKFSDVFRKYFAVLPKYEQPEIAEEVTSRVMRLFEDPFIGELGCRMTPHSDLRGASFTQAALEELEQLQTNVLDYKFKNPQLLLAAVTHPSGKSWF